MPTYYIIEVILLNGKWNLPEGLRNRSLLCFDKIWRVPVSLEGDSILWKGYDNILANIIKLSIFDSLPNLSWDEEIWFKGMVINQAIFCWMAFLGVLKTSDVFSAKGLGPNSPCCFCNGTSETHAHLFFIYPFSMFLIRHLLPNGSFSHLNMTLS